MQEVKYKELLERCIDEILFFVWDPIGVNDTPEARREYESYVYQITNMVIEGRLKSDISEALSAIVRDRMGINSVKEREDKVAQMIINWSNFLKQSDIVDNVMENYLKSH